MTTMVLPESTSLCSTCSSLRISSGVQAGCWFIKDVERFAGGAFAQLFRQLNPLCLTARKRGGRLAKADIAQAHLLQGDKLLADGGVVGEIVGRFIHRHVQHIGD